MGLFGRKKEEKAQGQSIDQVSDQIFGGGGGPPAKGGGGGTAEDVRPVYVDLMAKRAQWQKEKGIKCFQVPAMNLMVNAFNEDEVVIAHFEPGAALVIAPPMEDDDILGRKIDAAFASVEETLRDATGMKGKALRIGWGGSYADYSKDDWASQYEDLKKAMLNEAFGLATFFDPAWLEEQIRKRAAQVGMRMEGSITEETKYLVFRKGSVPVPFPLLKHLLEMSAEVYPLDYLLDRVGALPKLEERLAKWASELAGAGIRPYDAAKDVAVSLDEMSGWSSVEEDPDISKSPQAKESWKLAEAMDGVELAAWTFISSNYPKRPDDDDSDYPTRYFVHSSSWAFDFGLDEEKGFKVHLDHERSNLAWRVWVYQKANELAQVLRAHKKADGHPLIAETGGLGHSKAMMSVLGAR